MYECAFPVRLCFLVRVHSDYARDDTAKFGKVQFIRFGELQERTNAAAVATTQLHHFTHLPLLTCNVFNGHAEGLRVQ